MIDNHEKFLNLLFELDKSSLDSIFKNEELDLIRNCVNEVVKLRMRNELDFKLTTEDGDFEIAPGDWFNMVFLCCRNYHLIPLILFFISCRWNPWIHLLRQWQSPLGYRLRALNFYREKFESYQSRWAFWDSFAKILLYLVNVSQETSSNFIRFGIFALIKIILHFITIFFNLRKWSSPSKLKSNEDFKFGFWPRSLQWLSINSFYNTISINQFNSAQIRHWTFKENGFVFAGSIISGK